MSGGEWFASELAALYPRMVGRCELESPPSPRYNCLAWAVGESRRSWFPHGDPDSGAWHWPLNDAPRGDGALGLDQVLRAFATASYASCADGSLVVGFEKIALYVDAEDCVLHAAWQREDGRWWSKLGDQHDVLHEDPEAPVGALVCRIGQWMQRPRQEPRKTPGT